MDGAENERFVRKKRTETLQQAYKHPKDA